MVTKVVTGYLPSVILLLFFYTVPPVMMLLSTMEGSISRSDRKKSACHKILYFTIWNVFFVNVLSGSLLAQLNAITTPKDLASQLAEAVPKQVSYYLPLCFPFSDYVLVTNQCTCAHITGHIFHNVCTDIRLGGPVL
jgi:calcium permeable stress-gated cation channel